jgi:hypothetical protein
MDEAARQKALDSGARLFLHKKDLMALMAIGQMAGTGKL